MGQSNLKTRVRFPSTINKENLEKLRTLSKATSIPMSILIDQGLELLFDRYVRAGQMPAHPGKTPKEAKPQEG